MMIAWEDEINAFHLSLADGRLSDVTMIEKLSVHEYYAYLQANKDRNDRIKADIDKAKAASTH